MVILCSSSGISPVECTLPKIQTSSAPKYAPDGAQYASTTKTMIAFLSQAPGRLKFQEGLLSSAGGLEMI